MKAGKLVELFAKLPAEFTAARNALAKELREGGDEERAKRVLELRRPTAAQWAANQLARRNEDDVAALVETTDRMRKMQARGTGAGDELRAAMGEQRGALARLETAAEGALREAGLSVSPAVLRSVQRTLQAAAAGDKDLRQALQEGRLESEQEPSGFEALLGAAEQQGLRRAVLREALDAMFSRGAYAGSNEELTPLDGDPIAALPVAAALTATLVRPALWKKFHASAVGPYAVTPEAWRDIVSAADAETSSAC